MQANRHRFTQLILIFALFFIASSCVEEYWPELNANSEQLLVIDGKITNSPGPYQIKLSTSTTINDAVFIPLSLAKVIIIDNQGNQEYLQEKNPGIYETHPDGIQGIIGRSYKLRVELNSGKIYETALEEMKDPVAVEEVYVEESIKLAENSLEIDQEGYQFYVSSKRAESSKTYLYWEIEETYEYHADYKIIFLADGRTYDPTKYNRFGLAQTINQDTLFYCWKTQSIPERFIYSTEYLSNPTVNDLPLHFIPFADERLRYKYSILVKQYAISEDAYTFLDKLEQQNSSQDALFTTQPFQVRGNAFNVDDASEAVLGYFMVAAGVNGPRLLTKAPDRIRYNETKCFADTTDHTIQLNINLASSSIVPIYFTLVYFPPPEGSMFEADKVWAYVRQNCVDCTRQGGVAIKPEYWDW